jgi:hypothetical protein
MMNYPNFGAAPFGNFIFPPSGGQADYGLLHDFYLIGGYSVLDTISDRNSIPIGLSNGGPYSLIDQTYYGSGRRKIGMLVYVQSTDETFRLIPKGYLGNGGTGATGTMQDWVNLPPWDKAVLLDPTAQDIRNDTETGFSGPPDFVTTYGLVTGSGNPDDCWVKVSTETDVTYVAAYEISANVYGGTGSKEILSYKEDVTYLLKFPSTNTGPATISIDNFAQTGIKKQTPAGLVDLSAGDILTDIIYPSFYDGTYFQIPIPSSNLGIYGPNGDLLSAGATGIQFLGTGISASVQGSFVSIEVLCCTGAAIGILSQGVDVVGGTAAVQNLYSINFVDGSEDQTNYIQATTDSSGNVTVSVKTPGIQSSTITYTPTKSVGEKIGTSSVTLIRTLSGESDKLVPSLVKINYTFEDVTAVNGLDYTGIPGSISFLSTSGSSFSIPFQITNLSGIQPDRVFNINYTVDSSSTGNAIFSNFVSGATGTTAFSAITIFDEDQVSVSGFNFSPSTDTKYEPKLGIPGSTGDSTNFYKIPVVFSKTQSGTLDPLQGQVQVNLLESQSTAVRGSDYAIYYNGSANGATSWLINYSSYGTNYDVPIYIVPLRNPTSYDTASLVKFQLTGATASGQVGVTFPASVTTSNTYTFNIKNADITTVSTFTFTSTSFGGIPEGQTGDVVLQRSVTTFGGYSTTDPNVNYWQPTTTTVDLQIKNTSTADLGVDYQNPIDFYSQQTGGSPVQTINFSTPNPATITFPASSNPLPNPVFSEKRWMRIRTINNEVPEPPNTDRTIYLGLTGATGTIGGVQKALLGIPKDTNIFINDPSQWASSVFSVTVDNASPTEPKQGDPQKFITFTISRNLSAGSVPDSINVYYKIEPITAVVGTDYQVVGLAEGTITFTASGNSTFTIQAQILPQVSPAPQESNRTFKITLISATYTNPSTTGLATISPSESTVTVTILDTFDEIDYNRTVLLIHGGLAQFPLTANLTSANAVYTIPTGPAPNYPNTYTTTDLSELMYKMQTIGPPFFPVINTVTLPKNQSIPQLATAGTQTLPWLATPYSLSERYYFAIPTNEEDLAVSPLYYPQNLALMTPTYLKNSAGQPTRAVNANNQGKPFILGGKGYKLYITGDNSSSVAQAYTFGLG